MTTAPIFCCFKPQKIEFIFLDIDLFLISSVSKQHTHSPVSFYLRNRPFNLKGGLWFFASFRIFFSDNTRVRIFIFIVAQSANFFPDFNIMLYDKNSESDFFFSLHQNQNIFFSNIENQNIFLEKNHNPPFKLNGRSLIFVQSIVQLLLEVGFFGGGGHFCCYLIYIVIVQLIFRDKGNIPFRGGDIHGGMLDEQDFPQQI